MKKEGRRGGQGAGKARRQAEAALFPWLPQVFHVAVTQQYIWYGILLNYRLNNSATITYVYINFLTTSGGSIFGEKGVPQGVLRGRSGVRVEKR